METLTLQLQTNPQETVHILLCYRPPGPKSQLLSPLTEFISTYTLNSRDLLLLGDFNLWANSSQDPVADACIDHLEGLGLQQLVCGPTHTSGHTLDLIFRQDLEIHILKNEPLPWTDHHAIKFTITINAPSTKALKPETMQWTRLQKKLHSELFKTTLHNKIKTIDQH